MITFLANEGVNDILLSWPHWVAELTVEALTGLIVYPFFRMARTRWHRQHDEQAHGRPQRRRVRKAPPCDYPSAPCSCTNGIGCRNVPVSEW